MANTHSSSIHPAWYKQFWPWFLIFFPAVAVVAGIATIIIAVKSDDGLVKDDYYKAGLAINQVLESKLKARQLAINADVEWDQLTQTVTVKLNGKILIPPPRLLMQLAHTTRANYDQNIDLFLAPDKKSYTGRAKPVKNGNWNIILEPENKRWNISSRVKLPKQTNWHMTSQE